MKHSLASSRWVAGLAALVLFALFFSVPGDPLATEAAAPLPGALNTAGDWPMYGRDLQRTNFDPDETIITPATVGQLVQRWQQTIGMGEYPSSSGPVVANGKVFVGSSAPTGPNFFAFDAVTGTSSWSTNLGYEDVPECPPNVGIGATAAVSGTLLVAGGGDMAYYGLDTATGNQIWRNPLDAGPSAFAWSSPLLGNGRAYIGAASYCDNPSIRGEARSLNLQTGAQIANQYFVPANERGAGVWNSPALSPDGHTLVVATGEDYVYDGPYNRAMVTLDAYTFAILGANKQGLPYHDHDWGSTPIIFHDNQGRTLVGANHKNGTFYTYLLDNVTAGPIWQRYTDLSAGAMPAYDPTFGSGGTLFIVGNRHIYAVDPATGNDRWPAVGTYQIFGGMAIANGMIFINLGGRGVQILSETDGSTITYLPPSPTGETFSGPVIAHGMVYWTSGPYLNAWGLPPGSPTATSTGTPSTSTPTLSRTRTPTPTLTYTGVPGTPTNTTTATNSPTISPTPTPSPSPSPTAGSPTPTPSCVPDWSIVSSPNSGPGDNSLHAVVTAAPGDVWAVGSSHPVSVSQTLIQRLVGNTWTIVPSPNAGGEDNSLEAVAALNSDDIWAVGTSRSGGVSRTLIERWDGSSWTVVPSPNVGSEDNQLYGVATFATGDAWAVGSYRSSGASHTLIEHWDGSVWAVVPSPDGANGTGALQSVSIWAGHDVWAVGYSDTTLIEHWDGVSWTVVPSPNPGAGLNILLGVASNGPDDVWAVGYYRNGFGSLPLVEHWDGTSWAVVPCPNPGEISGFNELYGVAPLAANDVWAVGYDTENGIQRTMVQHWDGASWSVVSSPNFGVGNNRLQGVSAVSPSEVWAVGGGADTGATRTLIEQYNGACAPPSSTPSPSVSPSVTSTATPLAIPSSTNTPIATMPASSTPAPTSPTVTRTPSPCAIAFSDVNSTDYFYESVTYLYCHGAISGYSDGTFRPYNNTTRGQLSKIVVLAEGWTIDTTGAPHFSDVQAGSAFYDYTETAYNHSVISGYADGTFRWGNSVTRGQLSKIIVLAQVWQIDTTGGPHFLDVPPSNAFYSYIETAYNHGIISGYADGTFRWGNSATRGQISKIVYGAVAGP